MGLQTWCSWIILSSSGFLFAHFSNLKKEIHQIRMCSVLRAGDDQAKICLRCHSEMGVIFNRGSLCPSCKYKVCKNCQEVMFNGSWLCRLCYKQRFVGVPCYRSLIYSSCEIIKDLRNVNLKYVRNRLFTRSSTKVSGNSRRKPLRKFLVCSELYPSNFQFLHGKNRE